VTNSEESTFAFLTGCGDDRGEIHLVYGTAHGAIDDCGPESGTEGIIFTRQGTPPGSGRFQFVQLIKSDNAQLYGSQFCTDFSTSGLDGQYPYRGDDNNPLTAADGPDVPVALSPPEPTAWGLPVYTLVDDEFSARMYLLWRDGDPTSIPVPLGYIDWTWNASGHLVAGVYWTATPYAESGSIVKQFADSTSADPNLGFPTWIGPAYQPNGSCLAGN
jgi:hypothetical protein